MIDVTVANFQAEVIEASSRIPVLIDFWAPWCGPCKVIGPLLEKIEADYGGRFQLVKIDSDQEQQLGAAFGIRSIPTCILMVNGQPVDGFQGALPESKIIEFLDKHLPPAPEPEPEPELAPEPEVGSPDALAMLHAAVENDPSNDGARFNYVKALLQIGALDDAKVAFAPVIAKTGLDRKLDALQRWMNAIDTVAAYDDITLTLAKFSQNIAANKRDFESRFATAQIHMTQQHWTAAMDELLDILMRDKTWESDKARKTYIAILEIIEPPPVKVADGQIPPVDPVVATYRRRLSSVILS